MSKLLPNLPIEDLIPENDYLGIIDKGEIIKTFLQSNKDQFSEIKMFSLYGEWGSGKSTLMKYLEKELKSDFNTFFFEAWQYESDDNLSLSLLEYLSYETSDSTDKALGEIVEVAAKLFKGFSKSLKISIPGLSIDGSKLVETLEEEPKETFYQLKKKFNEEFLKWEGQIISDKKPNFNIVFIDDLDRCEPENVLNLLSALKLFFTYGVKTIFFCGVDEKAVKEAVNTKYGEVVKSNEYLEKVFDISFHMPKHDDLLKLVSLYFDDRNVKELDEKCNVAIADFLNQINFTNPRRLKKILNKYQILRSLKSNLENDKKNLNLIPNIYIENDGNFFETIFTLYFLITYEFERDVFNNFFDFELKKSIYKNIAPEDSNFSSIYSFNTNFLGKNFNEMIKAIRNRSQNISISRNAIADLIKSFSPINPTLIADPSVFYQELSFQSQFIVSEKKIDYYFSLYLLRNIDQIKKSTFSDFSFSLFKPMIYKLL